MSKEGEGACKGGEGQAESCRGSFIFFLSFLIQLFFQKAPAHAEKGIQTHQKPQMQTQHIHCISYKSIRHKSLHLFTSWWTICLLEAADHSCESCGQHHCISFVSHHPMTNRTLFGVGGWLHDVQGKYHVFSKMYMHCAFSFCFFINMFWQRINSMSSNWAQISIQQFQAAEKEGNLNPEKWGWRNRQLRKGYSCCSRYSYLVFSFLT